MINYIKTILSKTCLVMSFLGINSGLLAQVPTSAENDGVHFENELNWQQVLSKAKAENKFIFLDSYSDTSEINKKLEAEVFSSQYIAKLVNGRFLALKAQPDHENINALVIFSPRGEILYRSNAHQNLFEFAGLLQFATDPEMQQSRKELDAYQNGRKDYPELPGLIYNISMVLGNDSLADKMAKDYFKNYLNRQTNRYKILTPENMKLALAHYSFIDSNDKIVKESKIVKPQSPDSLTHLPGSSTALLSHVAEAEDVEAKLWKQGKISDPNPNWEKIEQTIVAKYPQVDAKELIREYILVGGDVSKFGFYERTGNSLMLNKYQGLQIQRLFEAHDFDGVNGVCWYIYFFRVADKPSLELASRWMDTCLEKEVASKTENPNHYDTRSALLYKTGHRQAAVADELKAIELTQNANAANQVDKYQGCDGFIELIEQMKKGIKIHAKDGAPYPPDWVLLD